MAEDGNGNGNDGGESVASFGTNYTQDEEAPPSPIFRRSSLPFSVGSSILGREIFEPRERFTLYKVEVNNGERVWVVYRRYSDFVLLNKKLKKLFPNVQLNLPPKRFFKDNFSRNFIDRRQAGLEEFMRNLFCLQNVLQTNPVRKFFRLDNPPGPGEDLESSKMHCRGLEDTLRQLKRELKEQTYELSHLRSELTRQEYDAAGSMANNQTLSERVLQQKLIETEEHMQSAKEEIERLKCEMKAEHALLKSSRHTERQRRELQLRDLVRVFQEKQRCEDEAISKMVNAFCELGKVRIDIGGKCIDVKTADGVSDREQELRGALVGSRQELEKLYREHMEVLSKEVEDQKTELVRSEYQLQTARAEVESLKNTLAQVHAKYHQEIISRDKFIHDYQRQLSDLHHYITSTEQKYFYSLVLGVKLNMAFWGKCIDAINQLKPGMLFSRVMDQGISIEHWPSWVSRELTTLADMASEERK